MRLSFLSRTDPNPKAKQANNPFTDQLSKLTLLQSMSQPKLSRQRLLNLFYRLGLILMLVSLSLPLFYESKATGYILLVGSLLYTISQALIDRSNVDLRTKRLRGMALLAGALFVAGSYLFIVEQSYWRLVLMVASVLLLYSNVVLLYHKPRSKEEPPAEV